jgi:hypothetical protein
MVETTAAIIGDVVYARTSADGRTIAARGAQLTGGGCNLAFAVQRARFVCPP